MPELVASTIRIESGGRIAIMNNPGTSYENLVANITVTAFFGPSDMRLKTLVDKVHTAPYQAYILSLERQLYGESDSSGL
jgi:hypothetical protein